ncbi:MAG: 4-hydroxy-tetrahydrodipicolinate reductase [Tistlia sp.]|uniref:4-hydroxy-tetrahydrodipicolinate reductase n=1 Tax=Tistlia sp. TaxID=3057121 RepID=UPI0034A1A467
MTRICLAGATGWTGRAVAAAALDAEDVTLVGAVARRSAGQDLGEALGRAPAGLEIAASVEAALAAAEADVLVDYTHPSAVKDHALTALARGVSVVVGTSGLIAEDYAELDAAARAAGRGVLASGNFAITAALLSHFALIAARFIEHFEVIDYAKAAKPDAPSGTARELAERLGEVRRPRLDHPIEQTIGPKELRGGSINGVQVHSVRLPSYTASVDALFTVPGARLKLTHDAGTDASVYAQGTLLGARRVGGFVGLKRGLDQLLFD